MDNKTYISQLSELKVMSGLASQGYHIFNQSSGKAPFDIIAYKDGLCKRVSVKATDSEPNKVGKYQIQLRRIRSNKTSNKIYKIEENEFDILAIYILKEDKVIYVDISEVIGRSTINI